MPFYEYECSACKFYVESLQKISDPPLIKCPSCSKDTMQRLISAPVFRLKGAGWYETDFKSDKENKRNLVGDGEPAASSDSDEKKTTVRASKALKKVAAKKAAKKSAGKSAGSASKAKVVGKSAKKSAKPAAKKLPAKKKVVAKKTAPKATKKAAKKTGQKPARKPVKKPAKKSIARKK